MSGDIELVLLIDGRWWYGNVIDVRWKLASGFG
jgi:hypothetical protein